MNIIILTYEELTPLSPEIRTKAVRYRTKLSQRQILRGNDPLRFSLKRSIARVLRSILGGIHAVMNSEGLGEMARIPIAGFHGNFEHG